MKAPGALALRRPQGLGVGPAWAPEAPLLAGAALASVGCGALLAHSALLAAVPLVACLVLALALARPRLLFAAGIALLAVEPGRVFGEASTAGQPATYKLVLYACILPLLLRRGVSLRKAAPLFAYAAVMVLAGWFGSPFPGLTTGQTVSSLATLSLGWVVFALKWDWRRDRDLLKVAAVMPALSVLVGAALQAVGVLAMFRGSPPRLQGATIAAWLGTFAFAAALACLVLARRSQWPWAKWLGLANVAILGATLTRGAVLALAVTAAPAFLRFARQQLLHKGNAGLARLGALLVIGVVGAALLVPGLRERNESSTSVVAGQAGEHDLTSGRLRAWAFAYEQAKANLLFGRGVGAGPIVGKSPGGPAGFTAQHNEYVRMLLETGIVGGLLLLAAMAASLTYTVRRAPRVVRADLMVAAVALAVYSVTENTLSSAPIAMALFLVLGVGCSRASGAGEGAAAARPCGGLRGSQAIGQRG